MSGPPPHAAYGAQGYGPTYAEGGYGAQVPMRSQAAGVAHAGHLESHEKSRVLLSSTDLLSRW